MARLGRAPQPTSSADTGGGHSTDDEKGGREVNPRQKESLLIQKAKQMQEVRAGWAGYEAGRLVEVAAAHARSPAYFPSASACLRSCAHLPLPSLAPCPARRTPLRRSRSGR